MAKSISTDDVDTSSYTVHYSSALQPRPTKYPCRFRSASKVEARPICVAEKAQYLDRELVADVYLGSIGSDDDDDAKSSSSSDSLSSSQSIALGKAHYLMSAALSIAAERPSSSQR